jgi:hypothetical protein
MNKQKKTGISIVSYGNCGYIRGKNIALEARKSERQKTTYTSNEL